VDWAKHAYEGLFTKTVRLSLEPVAPTAGLTAGIGIKPRDWRSSSSIKMLRARASASVNKDWAIDGSFAWQGYGEREWRVEPYVRLRSMKRLNFFGVGNTSSVDDRADFAMLDRRVGTYAYRRPLGWLAIGARVEGLWPRTSKGHSPALPSVDDSFAPADLPGFKLPTNYVYIGAFTNLNYPYVRSERPRRGGDYLAAFGLSHDTSGSGHSFRRLELEAQERFPFAGNDWQLTLHGRMSSSMAAADQLVPFYLMDTLGGADNLRGFKEAIIGSDETTSTLRSFESFRFRDNTTLFFQPELRKRVISQVFVSVFADIGAVAPTVRELSGANFHHGVGIALSVFKVNSMAVRLDFAFWGGEGHQLFFTPGRGLSF